MSYRSCRLIAFAVVSLLLLEQYALADAGAYQSAVEDRMLTNTRKSAGWSAIPDDIKVRFSSCVAASAVDGFTPEEMQQLNLAVSGGPEPDKDLWKRAIDRLNEVVNKTGDNDLSVLESVCPNDIADFKNYSF